MNHFKKIHEDEHSATIQHPDGHNIVIAKSGLSKSMKDALGRIPLTDRGIDKGIDPLTMSKGGDVSLFDSASSAYKRHSNELDPEKPIDKDEKGNPIYPANEPGTKEEEIIYTDQKMADGGEVDPEPQSPPVDPQLLHDSMIDDLYKEPVVEDSTRGMQFMPGQPGYNEAVQNTAQNLAQDYAMNTDEEHPNDLASREIAMGGKPHPLSDNFLGKMPGSSGPQVAPGVAPGNDKIERSDLLNPSKSGQKAAPFQDPFANIGSQYEKEFAKHNEANQKLADIAEQQAKQRQDATQDYMDKLHDAQFNYEAEHDAVVDRHERFREDVQNGHIDPNRYIKSMSEPSRIMSGLGILLSGFGMGIMGKGGNPALDYLSKQIDRDIESQRLDLGRKENLLSANFKEFGELRDSSNMARLQIGDMFIKQLQNIADQSVGDSAKVNANLIESKYNTEVVIPLRKEMALNRMMFKMGAGQGGVSQETTPGGARVNSVSGLNPSTIIQRLAPEKERERLMKDAKELEDHQSARQAVLSSFDKVANLSSFSKLYNPLHPYDSYQNHKTVEGLINPVLEDYTHKVAGRTTAENVSLIKSAFARVGNDAKTNSELRRTIDSIMRGEMNYPSLRPYGVTPDFDTRGEIVRDNNLKSKKAR